MYVSVYDLPLSFSREEKEEIMCVRSFGTYCVGIYTEEVKAEVGG